MSEEDALKQRSGSASKRSAPSALRNREVIADVLAEELPEAGLVLEIASGTGEHAVYNAARFPKLTWQPTDPDAEALTSIEAWRTEKGLPNILPALELDAASAVWPVDAADAMLCINMVHISPIAASEGLFAGAGRLLPQGAPLVLYGPYREPEVETVQSNLDFEGWLKAKNPEFGLRNTEWIDELARKNDLSRTRRLEMPANNLILVYRKG